MLNRLKSWIAKHFITPKFEFPVLTTEERLMMPVGVELV